MKVAFYTRSFPTLSETFVIDQIIAFKNQGIDVSILTSQFNTGVHSDKVAENELNDDIQIIGSKLNTHAVFKMLRSFIKLVFSNPKKLLNIIKLLVGLDKPKLRFLASSEICKAEGTKTFDAIIAHFGDNGVLVEWLREFNILRGNLFIFFHGADMSSYRAVDKLLPLYKRHLFNKKDVFLLPISAYWQQKLILWGANETNMYIQHMGVHIEKQHSLKNRPFSKPPKIIQVGRLVEKKAILDSISAVIEVNNTHKVNFIVVGDGPQLEMARALVKKNHAEDSVTLLGAQSHSKVQALLQESDIFILPSVTASNGDKEGIPVSIMEAMRDELIVISTKHSGIPELIEDGKNGFLVEERSPELIVQKLRDIIVMKESELADIRLNAFRKVASEFDISQLNIQLIKYCKGKLLKS